MAYRLVEEIESLYKTKNIRPCCGLPLWHSLSVVGFFIGVNMNEKQCTSCKRNLPETSEYFHRSGKWFHGKCKRCRSSVTVEINTDDSITKSCTKCTEEKPATLEFFHKSKREKDGLRSQCKICRAKEKLEFRAKNRDRILKQSREYHARPEIKQKMHEYRTSERYRKMKREREKERRETDPLYKLTHYLRTSFNRYVKKENSTFEYIGIDKYEFFKYIESRFTEGMTWDNYGKWHIDHIKPLASFDFSTEEEIYKAWNYKNLQPLWAEDNLKKGRLDEDGKK